MALTKNTQQANSTVKVAALIVAGIYLYRRFTEGTAEELKASKTIPSLGRFAVGWSVVFFGLSVAAGPAPGFAGDAAILLVLGSLLTNGVEVSKDLSKGLEKARKPKEPTAAERRQHEGKAPTSAQANSLIETRAV
jgi:hypothetical protein